MSENAYEYIYRECLFLNAETPFSIFENSPSKIHLNSFRILIDKKEVDIFRKFC